MLFPLLLNLHNRDLWRKEGSLELGIYGQKDLFLWSITSNNSFICSAGGLRGFSLNFLALKHLLLFLGITLQSTSRWIWWCQKDRIITIQQLTLVLGRRAWKRGGPSLTHRPYPTVNPTISIASAAVDPELREVDGCPSFLEKRDRRERSFFKRKSSQCTQIFTLKDIACVLLAQIKDAKIVCVIGCQIKRTQIHSQS